MPDIDVYVTTILSNTSLRGRHERVEAVLRSLRVPYSTHDVASDEQAKRHWKRKDPTNELPCILVDDERVGSVADLDEAVEFGELRQFLRLDSPPPPPPEKSPSLASAAGSPNPDGTRRPSIFDFAALDLTAEEARQLEEELARGETFDSALAPPEPVEYTSTQRHQVQPLKLTRHDIDTKTGERIQYVRPLGDRPLAQDAPRNDFEGLEDVKEDELEALARQLEEEDRLQSQAMEAKNTQPLPPPPAEDSALEETAKPNQTESKLATENTAGNTQSQAAATDSNPRAALESTTSIEGAGELSAPLAEIEQLKLSPEEVSELQAEVADGPTALEVEQPSELELTARREARAAEAQPAEEDQRIQMESRSSVREVEQLKAGLKTGSRLVQDTPVPEVVAAAVSERAGEHVSHDGTEVPGALPMANTSTLEREDSQLKTCCNAHGDTLWNCPHSNSSLRRHKQESAGRSSWSDIKEHRSS